MVEASVSEMYVGEKLTGRLSCLGLLELPLAKRSRRLGAGGAYDGLGVEPAVRSSCGTGVSGSVHRRRSK